MQIWNPNRYLLLLLVLWMIVLVTIPNLLKGYIKQTPTCHVATERNTRHSLS